jgi:hypothetical protein
MKLINQKRYLDFVISGGKGVDLQILQGGDRFVIEEKKIPELLNYIKENFDL